MSDDTSARETAPHSDDGWVALVQRGQDEGDWKPVVDWLVAHPGCAPAVAEFLRLDGAVRAAAAPARASHSDLAGATVGGVELRELVGKGGTAWVFRGYQPALRRAVAVKLIHTGDPARFRVEAERAGGLEHENVVRVYEFGETERGSYLVMPLLTGGSLDAHRRARPGGRLPPAEAARLVRDVARGVHHAHQRGLIHRDLKPLNVLLDDAGTPKVADFGLARPIDGTASVGVAGTFAYMAPEQARGDKGLTTAVDVWALGVTLFELLTGRLPFGAGPAAVPRVLADPAPGVRELAPDVGPDLEAVYLKCLEKSPEARYPTAQEVADELGRVLRGEPVAARPPGFWDWLRQLARTRPEPHPRYSWQVTVWFGVLSLLGNGLVYAMARTDFPAAGVWAANGVAACGYAAVLWWYMLRRFRELPVTERHSLIIAIGYIVVYFPLMAAFVPLSLSAPARAGLGIYPPLTAFSGFGFFVLGSTNWSRFFPIGLLLMGLVPVMTRWPDSSPLVFGATTALVVWYWSYAKKGGFGYRADDPPRD